MTFVGYNDRRRSNEIMAGHVVGDDLYYHCSVFIGLGVQFIRDALWDALIHV